MKCRSCSVQVKYSILRFCDTCKEKYIQNMYASESMYNQYIKQKEQCACCKSYCIYTEMLYDKPYLLCIRCDVAKFRFRSYLNVKRAKVYMKDDYEYRKKKKNIYNAIVYRNVMKEGYKRCSDCQAWYPKKGSYCKPCKKQHGRDLYPYRKDRHALLTKYDYRCEICNGKRQSKYLAIDHDHKTGKFRGILCVSCNGALGLMYDSKDMLEQLRKYMLIEYTKGVIEFDDVEVVEGNFECPEELDQELIKEKSEELYKLICPI